MRLPVIFPSLAVSLLLLSSGTAVADSELEAALQPDLEAEEIPLAKKKKKKSGFKDDYRYNWEDRHLTLGINMGGALAGGNTLNAFPFGAVVTPYFKGAFGDGNALQLDISVGAQSLLATDAEWLFFRTPILPGSVAYGYTAFIAPNVQFRYELDLGTSISKRSPFLFWGGLGLGSFITSGYAELTSNGPEGIKDQVVTNTEVFFDFVPTMGLKARLGEFGYFEVGYRQHLLLPIASLLNEQTAWVTGRPSVIEEFFIGGARLADFSFGFSYDFK